jgi:activator of 2-hydroxyglutaryl-CoA dehydratase
MSSLASIIRLHKWQLDEKRRALAELQTLADRLKAEMEKVKVEVAAEQEAARNNPDFAFNYGNFAQAALERSRRLAESLVQVDAQVAVATDEMAEAFQEVKRYELAEEERKRREQDRLRQKENLLLDETALVGFRRRQQEG